MLVHRRWFHRQLVVGCLTWPLLGLRNAWAFRFGFGARLGDAIGAGVAAGLMQAVGEMIEGVQAFIMMIPLLLIEAFLDRFADVLKLDDDQRQQLKKSREDLLKDLLDVGGAIVKRPEAERGAAMYAEFQRLAPTYRQRVMDILKPEQRQRLVQIERQFQGTHAMLSGDVGKQLTLSEEQRKALTVAADELGEKMQSLRSGKDNLTPLMLGRLLVMRKLADVKAHKMLTDEQNQKWRELTGEPISIGDFIPWDKLLAALNEKEEKPAEKDEKGPQK